MVCMTSKDVASTDIMYKALQQREKKNDFGELINFFLGYRLFMANETTNTQLLRVW